MEKLLAAIEEYTCQDPGQRGIGKLRQHGHLALGAASLLQATKVLIVSGFYIPQVQAGETDGPPGAIALGQALAHLGIAVEYATDIVNNPYFEALQARPLHNYHPGLIEKLAPSHLVAVERLGRAADGRYYNMRGEDLTEETEPLDQWFLDAPKEITTIAIGDGGNEVGMGRVSEETGLHITNGSKIACVVPTDYLVVSGISNWGAYGLVQAMSLLSKKDLLPDNKTASDQLNRIVDAGAVDGVTRVSEPTVDGFPLSTTLEFLDGLRKLSPTDQK